MNEKNAGTAREVGATTIVELLERRSTLQQWIDRLREHESEISPRVLDRVRADYRNRLETVTIELGEHQESIREQLTRLDEELHECRAALEDATDALDEARLRNRIGELTDEEWEQRRTELEAEVERESERRATLETEAGGLRELLFQVARDEAESPVAAAPDEPADLEEEPDIDTFAAEWSALGVDDEPSIESPVAPAGLTAGPDELDPAADADSDLAFLEELDRAIADSGPGTPAATEEAEPDEPLEPQTAEEAATPGKAPTAVQRGVKCPECGYTNDTSAWYCGVCGVDLA